MAIMPPGPRLRIVFDGRHNLQIFDADGNEVLKDCVRGVKWELDCSEARIWIEIVPRVAVDVEGDVAQITAVFPVISLPVDR